MRKSVLLFMAVLLALPMSLLIAGTLKGITMPDTIQVEDQTLVLNGMAVRKKFIFKVYIAGLYLPQKENDAEKILKGDTMRQCVMHWVRSVGVKKINGGWYDGLKDNTPNHSPELKKQFDTMAGMMEDVKDGNLIVFTYVPGKGTEVKVKDKVKGVVEGKAFADALFACWIGPDPGPGEGFKDDLLGKD